MPPVAPLPAEDWQKVVRVYACTWRLAGRVPRARDATATIEGRTVYFIGRDMFVRNKVAAGRRKDLADAARLGKSPRK